VAKGQPRGPAAPGLLCLRRDAGLEIGNPCLQLRCANPLGRSCCGTCEFIRLIAVIDCAMKVRSIVFDLAFGVLSIEQLFDGLRSRIMKIDHSSTRTRLL